MNTTFRFQFSAIAHENRKVGNLPVYSHVEAIAPATSANLGAGFDNFGVALDALYDRVSVDVVKGDKKVKLIVKGRSSELIPTKPEENSAGIVAESLLKASGKSCGLIINIKKGIKPGSGLGSSAASAAASALAINEALGLGLTDKELIRFASLGEIAAAGVPHADNVSASIMGFFTAIVSHEPFEVIRLSMPDNAKFVITTPDMMLETHKARSILPKYVALSDAVHNIAKATAFISGILTNNLTLMGMGMNDLIAEPYRAGLIPGFPEVKKRALEAGALGVAISGSGPSILALVDASKNLENNVAKVMKEGFEVHGIRCEVIITKPGPGARIVGREEK